MPARGEAGTWLLAESRAREKLADVLEERAVALGALGLDEFAWLPFRAAEELAAAFPPEVVEFRGWQALCGTLGGTAVLRSPHGEAKPRRHASAKRRM